MAKYRITIENLEGGDYEGVGTVEMTGFAIFGELVGVENGSRVIIHDLTPMEIAMTIASDHHLMPAAIAADGLYKSKQRAMEMESRGDLKKILEGLAHERK